MMNALFWRFVGLSLACSAVLLLLLLAAWLIRRRYAARTCYVLWLLLALRLMLPWPALQSQRAVTVEVPQYEVSLAPPVHANVQTTPEKLQEPAQTGTDAPVPTAVSVNRTISLTALLPGLWLMGVVGCGLWLAASCVLARRTLLRNARSGSPEDRAMLDALGQELGCKCCPELYRSDRVSTPMLLGLVRPVVLLPMGTWTEEELSLILRHELTHLRRHDVAYKLFMQAVCVVHWFNPLVWWMSREAGRSLELCCDEEVVRGRDKTFRRTYGDVLLKTAAGAGRVPALSARMGGGKGYLKVRLNNLFVHKKNSAALVCAVLAAAILGGSLVSCTGEVPEEKLDDDWNAVVTSFNDPTDLEELQKELKMWEALLESFDNPAPGLSPEDIDTMRKQVKQKYEELKEAVTSFNDSTDLEELREKLAVEVMVQVEELHAKMEEEAINALFIHQLEESVVVTRLGVVSFTIPAYYWGSDDWQIEIRGRAEYDGFGGMSLHYPFDRVDLMLGTQCTYNLSEQWSSITELYLSVTLGGQSKDIDLLTIVPSDTAGVIPEE